VEGSERRGLKFWMKESFGVDGVEGGKIRRRPKRSEGMLRIKRGDKPKGGLCVLGWGLWGG